MATLFLEPGGDADFGIGLWGSILNGPAVATDFVHGGHIKSIKYRPSNQDIVDTPAGSVTDVGGRASFYVYFNALPGASATLTSFSTSGFAVVFEIKMTSGGVLQLCDANGTSLGSNGATLVTGTWYRMTVCWKITTSTVNQFKTFVNGVSDISVTNATLINTGSSIWGIGNISTDTTLDMRSSDHYLDNSNALTDPGDIYVFAKRPFSNGTTNNFAVNGSAGAYGSGNARYANERPINTANFLSVTPASLKTEEYSIESQAGGDVNLSNCTIVDYMGWMDANVASTANSPVMKIIVGGTSTTKTLTTSFAIYTQIAGSTTYPAGNTDIGMSAQYTTTGHLVKLAECGIVFAVIFNSPLMNSRLKPI
jgi:hypothetical protein